MKIALYILLALLLAGALFGAWLYYQSPKAPATIPAGVTPEEHAQHHL